MSYFGRGHYVFWTGVWGGAIGAAAGRLGERFRLRSTEEFKETFQLRRETWDEYRQKDHVYSSWDERQRRYARRDAEEARAAEIAEKSAERDLARLKEEYLTAEAKFEEHHKHLIETTTRVGTAESQTRGYQVKANGRRSSVRTETDEVSQTHAHDKKYFDLEKRADETKDAYDTRYFEELTAARPRVDQEQFDITHPMAPPGVRPENNIVDWDYIREVHGDYADELMIAGAVVGAVIGAWLGSKIYDSENTYH